MADTKISALADIVTIADDDVLPIVDTSETATKKASFAMIRRSTTLDHIMQSDTTDQAIANVNNAQVITFDTDVTKQGIARTSASRFTIATAGTYLITFSGVAVGTQNKLIEMWVRVNGSDVANSNTIYTFKSTGGTAIITVNFLQTFTVGQYFEFWTWGDDTSSKWDATAAGTGPTRPACPSVIFTANRI